MGAYIKKHKLTSIILMVLGLFGPATSHAWHGGGGYYHGGGGYYRGGYFSGGGYYRGGGWGGPVIIIGGYYGPYYPPIRCQIVQQCYPSGSCIQQQVCN